MSNRQPDYSVTSSSNPALVAVSTVESVPQSASGGEPQSVPGRPDIVYTSGPDQYGVYAATIFGSVMAHCGIINNPNSSVWPGHPEEKFNPSLPVILSGSEALALTGVGQPGIDPAGPYYIARGLNVQVLDSLADPSWRMQNTTTGICAPDHP